MDISESDREARSGARARGARWSSIPLGLGAAFGLWLLGGWWVVAAVTAPRPSPIPPMSALAGAPIVDLSTVLDDGVEVRGWLAEQPGRRVVILLPGIGGDRRSLLGLARHYLARGWSVLTPDLRGTGESGGARVGLGYLERADVRGWVALSRARGYTQVGLHGQSLGAAAIAYWAAEDSARAVAFVALDSCYDELRTALVRRLPWVPLPGLTLKPVEWFGAAALGARAEELRPVEGVASLDMPVLFIASDEDSKVLPADTRRLFEACPSTRKRLHWVPGAPHTNLWDYDPQGYAAAVDGLLGWLPP